MPTLGLGPKIDVLNTYIEKSIKEIEEQRNNLPYESGIGWYEMESLFIWVLEQSDKKDYRRW